MKNQDQKDQLRAEIAELHKKITLLVSENLPQIVGIDANNLHIEQALFRHKEVLFWIDEAIYNSLED